MPGRALVLALFLAGPAVAAGDELGREVFTTLAQPPCALCHTLRAAAATGAVGPSLDEIQPDRQRVVAVVRDGIGVMPSFEGKLSDEQIEAVAEFVAKATRGE
ncbi:MAG TPA: cytochrome c [Zeimonas sp.]|nr:cytochrome c [Zeimonas sp.]